LTPPEMKTEKKMEKKMEKTSPNKKNATYGTGTVSDGRQTELGENFSISVSIVVSIFFFEMETEIFLPRHFVVTYFI
jgi:hypothetical protein